MSLEENKVVARQVFELLVEGNLALLDDHPGYWQSKQYFPRAFAGIPDLRTEIVQQLAEGDLVATRATLTGTHQGDFLGVAATGQTLSCDAFLFDRVVDGKVVEHNATADVIGFLIQLGAISPRPAEPESA